MSTAWSIFVIVGTIGSLLAALWLLLVNRQGEVDHALGHDYDGIDEYDNPLPAWWMWMFILSIVFAAGYMVWYPGLGNFQGIGSWTSTGQWQAEIDSEAERTAELFEGFAAQDAASLISDPQAMFIGGRLYSVYCATCHGRQGRGSAGFPNLTDNHWQWGGNYDNVLHTILNGRQAAMPGWGAPLGPEGTREVTHYVLQLSGRPEADAELAAAGQPKYMMFCVACHGPQGLGNAALGAPNITTNTWLYGGDYFSIYTTIAEGRMGYMPGQRDLVGPDRAHVLAAYVLSLSAEAPAPQPAATAPAMGGGE